MNMDMDDIKYTLINCCMSEYQYQSKYENIMQAPDANLLSYVVCMFSTNHLESRWLDMEPVLRHCDDAWNMIVYLEKRPCPEMEEMIRRQFVWKRMYQKNTGRKI